MALGVDLDVLMGPMEARLVELVARLKERVMAVELGVVLAGAGVQIASKGTRRYLLSECVRGLRRCSRDPILSPSERVYVPVWLEFVASK